MRRFLNRICNVETRSGTGNIRRSMQRLACLTAVGGAVAFAPAFAKDPPKAESRPINKLAPAAPASADAHALPHCLDKLHLSPQQQTQAHEIIQKYDAKLDAVWKQFGEKYMETVRTEVALLSAVEDNLTEQQRTSVREERRRVANAEKAMEGTQTKANRATDKPADSAEQVIAGKGITLTPEQEAVADKIQESYVGHLRSLNRDIQGIHNRLISIEADKFVELEKLLTKEQLAELREDRKTLAAAHKLTATDKTTKSE